MNSVLRRAGIGATALFAATAFTAPAFAAAAGPDLGVTLEGTTLALGADSKGIAVTVQNHGTEVVAGFDIVFDVSELDTTKVKLTLPSSSPTWCDLATTTCTFVGEIAPGENLDHVPFGLERVAGAGSGAAGKLTVKVSNASDANAANNAATADVVLSATDGADLQIISNDIVYYEDDDSTRPVLPGEETVLAAFGFNQGTKDAKGTKVSVELPEGVTFVSPKDAACSYAGGDREAVCTYPEDVLATGGGYQDDNTWTWWVFAVKVSSEAVGPVNLTGGVITVDPLAEVEPGPSARSSRTHSTPPHGVSASTFEDVDPSDNTDEFIAYVGKKGGTGGGLPVTGTQVNLIAGIGLGVIVAGGALFLITRRRRVTA